jgi:HNH endonuclease
MNKISNKIREFIAKRANFCCEYCHIPEKFLATTFHIDHIISQKHGGVADIDNLAYSCQHCNQNKGSDIATIIEGKKMEFVRFYNPRKDNWGENFELEGGKIIGITAIGKSTSKILGFNQIERVILRNVISEII